MALSTPPPLNGILLKRTARSLNTGGDTFAAREWWYDPATRTADEYIITETADGSTYSRPTDEVFDRFCLNPGEAPFTERQFKHNGSGGLTITPVNDVAACQISCTLTLTLTAGPTADGRADLLATASGAQGAVLFSLDDFATPGTSGAPTGPGSSTQAYPARPAGLYTVSARETRPNGCRATASVRVQVAYGPRYEHAFNDFYGAECLVRIYEQEYTGPVEAVRAPLDVLSLDYGAGGTDHVYSNLRRGSSAELSLFEVYAEQLLPLFSGSERLHRLEYLRNDALVWSGYLLPEQGSGLYLPPPTPVYFTATDGLGTLSDLPFATPDGGALRGDWTVLQVLLFCLGKLELALPLHTLVNLFPANATTGTPALEQTRVDVATYQSEKGKPWTCGQVVDAVLTLYQARLYQEAGAWWLERLSELSPAPLTYAAYAPDGTRLPDVTRLLLRAVEPPETGAPYWLGETQRVDRRGAVATVTVTVEEDELVNHLRFALPESADCPAPFPPNWTGFSTGTAPYAQLIYQGERKAPKQRLYGKVAYNAAPYQAPYIQSPPTAPLPFANAGALDLVRLRFTATPFGNTPTTDFSSQAKLYVQASYNGGPYEPVGTLPVRFPDAKAVDHIVYFSPAERRGPAPETVAFRFYAPAGGITDATVDITNLELIWGYVDETQDPGYTDEYTGETGQRVSRNDTDIPLFHSTTPGQRRTGSLLDGRGAPVTGFFEPDALGQLREAGDYLVRDRLSWQRRPAGVLSGSLRGPLLPGPGALFTDPQALRPGVHLLTAYQYHASAAECTLTGVELITLRAPGQQLPPFLIYNEDGTPWLSEAGELLTYEHAG